MSGRTLRAVADDLGISVKVVTAPDPIVTLQQAKAHLAVEHDEHDDLIAGLVAAATQHLDGPEGWLGRALGLQTLEVSADRLPAAFLPLPYPPLREVLAVECREGDAWAALDPATWELDPAGLMRRSGASWPSVAFGPGVVCVRFKAGYDPGQVPQPILQAILLTVGHFYRHRSAVAETTLEELPMGVQYLLAPFRVWGAA